jgi:hypothetical protein
MLQAIRWLHVVSGFLAFFMAPLALATVKGGAAHRRWGKVYFWSMVVVAVTAIVASLAGANYFLTFVSVFSFYMAFRGYRVLFRKYPTKGQGPRAMDFAGAIASLAASSLLLILGISQPSAIWKQLGPVAVVFGGIGVVFATADLRSFLYPSPDPHGWWFSHMGGMIGSYIAAVSAFSVTNLHFLPELIRWLWPSAVGVPAIIFWIYYYRRRFRPHE